MWALVNNLRKNNILAGHRYIKKLPALSIGVRSLCKSAQAINYDLGSTMQKELGTRLIEELNVCKRSKVLDLGCGTGYLAKVISEKVGAEGKVVAVDPDGERLKIARERHSASNIEYVQAGDQTFPLGQYDLVFSNIVIHWISDKRALFDRVYKNLRPGGCFAFIAGNGTTAFTFPDIGTRLFAELIGPEFIPNLFSHTFYLFDETDYRDLGKSTGFTRISTEIWDYYPEWKNVDDYIKAMHGWMHGKFDPSQFDPDVLQRIKSEHGDRVVTQSTPISHIRVILTKPEQE